MSIQDYKEKYGSNAPIWSQECLDRPSPMKGRKHPSKEKITKNLRSFKGEHRGKNIGVSGLPVYTVGKKYLAVWVDGKNRAEHRYVMEQHLGRRLETHEHVHHIDGNTRNNEISNLEILNHNEHNRLHMTRMRRDGTITPEHFKGLRNNPYGRKGKPKKEEEEMSTKKKINSRSKGSEYERKIARILGEWWEEDFHRTPMSGGLHWKEDNRVAGDIVTPPDSVYPFCTECKKRNGWEMDQLLKGTGDIEKWWSQSVGDADRVGLRPVLIFAKNFSPDYLMLDLDVFLDCTKGRCQWIDFPFLTINPNSSIKYDKARIVCKLEDFISSVSKEEVIASLNLS